MNWAADPRVQVWCCMTAEQGCETADCHLRAGAELGTMNEGQAPAMPELNAGALVGGLGEGGVVLEVDGAVHALGPATTLGTN